MGKDLLARGTGSSSGKKRMSDGDDEEPIWELSLGSIYRGADATSTPSPDGQFRVTIAQALPVQRRSPVADAMNPAAQAPDPAAGAALLAAGARIASSLLDVVNGAASTGVLGSLPVITSSRIHVTPAAALHLVAHVPAPAAGAAFIATGTSPRTSPAARPAHRPVRRRVANGSPPKPAPATNGTGPPLATAIPPFPWATSRVAIHHPIAHLAALGITTVEGEVHCSRCDARKTVSYNIASKFQEIRHFVLHNVQDMDDRAPEAWLRPTGQIPDCDGCGQTNNLRPVISAEKERINWIFLLLGQTLGLCTLDQLKFFCAHTRQHRTGAKDRVLFSAYMELCNQLCPDRLFKLSTERQNRGQQYSS
ncbi:unnamed protein product [Alopecurus aequalis]